MDPEAELLIARRKANFLRYRADRTGGLIDYQPIYLTEVMDELYRHSLEINEFSTPALENCLLSTCKRINVPRGCIKAFVQESSDYQAVSYFADTRRNVLLLSSRLVNNLSFGELEFVMGHEIGHFLLQHRSGRPSKQNPEYFVYQRAQEISADRVGLIGCASIDIANRALMKLASGLDDRFLSDESEAFTRQVTAIEQIERGESWHTTHPSSMVRALVLKQFSVGSETVSYDDFTVDLVRHRDSQVEKTLNNVVDAALLNRIAEIQEEREMWLELRKHIVSGQFTFEHQKIFSEKFGHDTLIKVKGFFSNMSKADALNEVDAKLGDLKQRVDAGNDWKA